VDNFAKPWGPIEFAVCEMLVDDPLNDHHHVRDFLVEHGVALEDGLAWNHLRDEDVTFRALRTSIAYVNGELGSNEAVFPSALIRKGKYPLIRQMRDVHQFDVGTHLAICYLMARRNAPGLVARKLGFNDLADELDVHWSNSPVVELEMAAIFHDFFKAFRSRRGLPSKLGATLSPAWLLPNGNIPPESALEEEGEIAVMLLPALSAMSPDGLARVNNAITQSTKWGSSLYRLQNYDEANAARVAAEIFKGFTKQEMAGIYLGILDWLGKGWALDIMTVRKERKLTLRAAGGFALQALNHNLAKR
jgi:hypothetical protein